MGRIRELLRVMFLFAGIGVFLLAPLSGNAFQTVQCGDSEYTFSGFLRNNLGMFTDTQEYAGSGNQLSTARTWLRLNGDFKFNEQWGAYLTTQLAYEPWYKYEQGNPTAENGGSQQHRRSGWKTYSEFDDINDVLREAFVRWTPNKETTIKIGRQIAIWGEAMFDRVGDVIHPNDGRFAFGFSNLEDTRIPQYMVRAVHGFSAINSSFEWLVMAPLVEDQYYYNRGSAPAMPAFGSFVEQRFSPYPEVRSGAGVRSAPAVIPAGNALPESVEDGWAGWRYGFRTATQVPRMQFGFSYFHTQSYDMNKSTGALQGYIPGAALGIPVPGLYLPVMTQTLQHPYMDIIGFYMNRQLSVVPGVVRAEVVWSPNKPFNTFDQTTTLVMNPGGPGTFAQVPIEDGIVRRDWVKYSIAYDLNSFFYFAWHKTAPFNITLEHVGEWVPNAKELQYPAFAYNTKQPSYHAGINMMISTDWLYGEISTMIMAGYDTFGNSGLFMPAITWRPGWHDQAFSVELKYLGVYGDDNYKGIGLFRKKDMVLLTTQFNF